MLKLTRLFLLVERLFLRIDLTLDRLAECAYYLHLHNERFWLNIDLWLDRQSYDVYVARTGLASRAIEIAIRFDYAQLDRIARRLDRIELGIGE